MSRNTVTALLLAGAGAALALAFALPARVGHPVTPLMESAAEAMGGRSVPAPPGEVGGGRPAVVVFIQPDCPCSEAYDPFVLKLYAAYGDRATFVGVVAGDADAADEWKRGHRTPYPVVPDPDLATARAYEATRSAYTALIIGDKIARLWPGYSAGMLREAGRLLAVETGRPAAELELTDAPKGLTSGCLLGE